MSVKPQNSNSLVVIPYIVVIMPYTVVIMACIVAIIPGITRLVRLKQLEIAELLSDVLTKECIVISHTF